MAKSRRGRQLHQSEAGHKSRNSLSSQGEPTKTLSPDLPSSPIPNHVSITSISTALPRRAFITAAFAALTATEVEAQPKVNTPRGCPVCGQKAFYGAGLLTIGAAATPEEARVQIVREFAIQFCQNCGTMRAVNT